METKELIIRIIDAIIKWGFLLIIFLFVAALAGLTPKQAIIILSLMIGLPIIAVILKKIFSNQNDNE